MHQSIDLANRKIWPWLQKGKLKRKTEPLLMVAQDNAIRKIYTKVKINNTQESSKCKLCDERDERVNYIREPRELTQK